MGPALQAFGVALSALYTACEADPLIIDSANHLGDWLLNLGKSKALDKGQDEELKTALQKMTRELNNFASALRSPSATR